MISLQNIKISNFLSHKSTEIKFEKNSKILISGKSGSGKSSIVDGLIWCFYNKSRTDSRFLVRRGTKGGEVSVILKDEETSSLYKIIRKITSKNVHKLDVLISIDGKTFKPVEATGLRGLQEFIEKDILKASYLLFINSVVCPQDNNDTFVTQTPARKKDILLEIINSDNYDEYLKKSKELLREKSLNLEATSTRIEEKENQITRDKEKTVDIEMLRHKENSIKEELLKINQEHDIFINDKQKHIEQISFIKGKENSLNDIVSRINTNNIKIINVNKNISELSISYKDIDQFKIDVLILRETREVLLVEDKNREALFAWKENLQKVEQSKPMEFDYDSQINSINQSIIKIMQEEVLVCLKCGTKYPSLEESKQTRIKKLEFDLNSVKIAKDIYEKGIERYNTQFQELGVSPNYNSDKRDNLYAKIIELEKSEKKLLELSGAEERIKQLTNDMSELTTEQVSLNGDKANIENEIKNKLHLEQALISIETSIAKCSTQKQTIEYDKTNNATLLLSAKEALKYIKENKKEILKLNGEIILIKKDIEALKLVKEAFGVNGIKATVIDYMIPELEERINNILSKLSEFNISIDTQRSGAEEGAVIEGLFIIITNEVGEEFNFENFSGGEKMKISYAINEALASLSKCNFRILDETVVALDDESLANFIEIVELLQEKVSNVICITHIQQIKDLFENQLEIIKKNGISELIN